jgi:hypothetical protein
MEWSELDFLNDMPVLKIYDTKNNKSAGQITQHRKKKGATQKAMPRQNAQLYTRTYR